MKQHSAQAGGEQGKEHIPERREQCAQADDDQDIEAEHAQGEQSVDERAIEYEIDVPQMVTQHRKANRAGDNEKGEGQGHFAQYDENGVSRARKDQRKQEIGDIPEHSYQHAEHDPLGLLPLDGRGDAPVAVELGEAPGEGQAQQERAEQNRWPAHQRVGRGRRQAQKHQHQQVG